MGPAVRVTNHGEEIQSSVKRCNYCSFVREGHGSHAVLFLVLDKGCCWANKLYRYYSLTTDYNCRFSCNKYEYFCATHCARVPDSESTESRGNGMFRRFYQNLPFGVSIELLLKIVLFTFVPEFRWLTIQDNLMKMS